MSTDWRRHKRLVVIPLAVLATASAGWLEGQVRPTPAIRPDSGTTLAALHPAIGVYSDSTLYFDPTLGAADSQRLAMGTPPVFGPHAKVEPEVGSNAIDSTDLARGRVIARIFVETTYDKLNLKRGWNYWWVDKEAGEWRYRFYSQSLRRWTPYRRLDMQVHAGYSWRQAIARFVWKDHDDGVWSTCGSNRCCATY